MGVPKRRSLGHDERLVREVALLVLSKCCTTTILAERFLLERWRLRRGPTRARGGRGGAFFPEFIATNEIPPPPATGGEL